MDSFKQLLIAQNNTETLILRILPNYHKLAKTKRTATAIRSRLNNLKTYWETFQAQHTRLCAIADAESKRDHEYFTKDKFLTISDSVEEITDTLSENLELLQPTPAQSSLNESGMTHESRHSIVQLSRIDIPKFSEDITKWESFRDRFQSMIIDEASLSNVQKLHHLFSSLRGVALTAIEHLTVTSDNFPVAWTILSSNFENERRLINAYIHRLFTLPNVTMKSAHELRALREKANSAIAALRNLDRPVDQ